MFFKNSFLSVLIVLNLFLAAGCSSRPSPQDVAQFGLDIYYKDYDAVKKTLKKNEKILYIGSEIFDGCVVYPIHMALRTNDLDMVKLIARKNTVNILFEPSMSSPLQLSINLNCDSEIIKLLIDKGADVNITAEDGGLNIFHAFCMNRNLEIWEVLKDYATSEVLNKLSDENVTPMCFLIYLQNEYDDLNSPEAIYLLKEFIRLGGNPNYLAEDWDFAIDLADSLTEDCYFEYKQVLLDGMKNNPPVGDSEKLVEIMENSPYN